MWVLSAGLLTRCGGEGDGGEVWCACLGGGAGGITHDWWFVIWRGGDYAGNNC
jgi:hypothetical protein